MTPTTVYDFEVRRIDGSPLALRDHRGQAMLIVNTASACGFTPQFAGLEQLHQAYGPRGLVVLGFPCNQFGRQDPGSNDEIGAFCQKNYGVSFPMMAKVDVNGPQADPAALGQRYAATLAALRLRDPALAATGLKHLRAAPPADADARQALDWLELEVLTALPSAAPPARLVSLRDSALGHDHRTSLLLGARASLGADPATRQRAAQRLQTWTTLHPRDATAWQALASLHLAQEQPVRAARAEAEARLAHRDAAGALERFKAAQQLARNRPTDHIELSILDARVREAEQLVREDMREANRR